MIIIFDSGIGGTELANKLLNKQNKAHKPIDLLYYADYGNFPYGNKTKTHLEKILTHHLEYFASIQATHIIFACNTASHIVKNLFNNRYKDIKLFFITDSLNELACQHPDASVICTTLTAKILTKQKILSNQIISMPELASAIENNDQNAIKQQITQLPSQIKKIIHGCTHYPLANHLFPSCIKILNPIDIFLETILNNIPNQNFNFKTNSEKINQHCNIE